MCIAILYKSCWLESHPVHHSQQSHSPSPPVTTIPLTQSIIHNNPTHPVHHSQQSHSPSPPFTTIPLTQSTIKNNPTHLVHHQKHMFYGLVAIVLTYFTWIVLQIWKYFIVHLFFVNVRSKSLNGNISASKQDINNLKIPPWSWSIALPIWI